MPFKVLVSASSRPGDCASFRTGCTKKLDAIRSVLHLSDKPQKHTSGVKTPCDPDAANVRDKSLTYRPDKILSKL
jgi:hypothetical protein